MQALPLTLILFILFPRVQGPLWGMPQDAYASSGLDDKMSPGSLSRLSLFGSGGVSRHYEGDVPPRNQMYWRGPVLWILTGAPGHSGRIAATPVPEFTDLGQQVDYVVTLEPHNKMWLFALEMPDKVSEPATLTYDFQTLRRKPITSRLRYTVRSNLSYRANLRETKEQLQRALQLPKLLQSARPKASCRMAEANRSESPSPPSPEGEGAIVPLRGLMNPWYVPRCPISTEKAFNIRSNRRYSAFTTSTIFYFSSKQGFWRILRSAFVFLMRAANVPARVVTGYLGGEFNDFGNYYIVRQSDGPRLGGSLAGGAGLGARRSNRRDRTGARRKRHVRCNNQHSRPALHGAEPAAMDAQPAPEFGHPGQSVERVGVGLRHRTAICFLDPPRHGIHHLAKRLP